MQPMIPDWGGLEDKLIRLADCQARLAELVEEQRRAIGKADPKGLAEVDRRIDAQLVELVEAEGARRSACQRLAEVLGLDVASAGATRLELFIGLADGRWAGRLRLAADRLAEQLQRLARAGRVNLNVARRLSELCRELLGQVSRIGRDTGCYDARGRKALAREQIAGAGCLSAIG